MWPYSLLSNGTFSRLWQSWVKHATSYTNVCLKQVSRIRGTFRIRGVPNSRCSEFKVSRIRGVPNSRCPEITVFRIQSVPNSRCSEFEVSRIQGVPNSKCPEFEVFRIRGVPNSRCSEFEVSRICGVPMWWYKKSDSNSHKHKTFKIFK